MRMEQKSYLKFIYKLHSKRLKKANWNLSLPLEVAMRDYPEDIVSLNDSQLLRFIDELNGISDINGKVKDIKKKIKYEKKKPKSRETKMIIKALYENLYNLQFQKDYVCIIMDSNSDYDRANKGFTINGIKYKRFLGTNGGIKNSTIVYVNEQLYPELKKRLDNGRNKDIPVVPAKLEAYQALICSGSTPIPEPKGIIVVNDCITFFKDDVIMINDEAEGEPIMTKIKDFEIEHNDSDGYGLMLPSYSKKVNGYLTGDDSKVISGMNTRYAWNKGMIYTFDFIEFAEKVAGTYEIIDAWGDKRDIRDAEVILTVSMLKLWNSYESWEDYYRNCQENHYQFSTPKTTPEELENIRYTNYQFLQSYNFTDEELQELCNPTIDEIKGVLGMDYRRSLVFLAGFGLNDENAFNDTFDYCVRALMIDKRMINDPFIRRKIWNMIVKRIEMAKRGAIKVNANFAMISGDPYALAQSMFGLEVTGLLKAGEIYHKYWIDKGSTELACFRAPMTCHNNIRKMKLCNNEQTSHWYQYISTAAILNAFDTACDAMNGADKDGDTNMDTDNPIIVKRTLNSPTIVCIQKNAEKKIATEEDIIQANKLAFNDDIGTVTNHVTSMIEVQAGFEPGSKEYETLAYRIMCGQLYQQNTIDRAKGIIAKPMPAYWYSMRDNMIKDDDTPEEIKKKEFNQKIVAANKPYFMTYVYPALRTKNNTYMKNSDYGAIMRFSSYGIHSVQDLYNYEPKTQDMINYLDYYERFIPVGYNACVVNRICWIFEKEFNSYLSKKYEQPEFDYNILKSHVEYSRRNYESVLKIYEDYQRNIDKFQQRKRTEKMDAFECWQQRTMFVDRFKRECEEVCTNEHELCDIVLDISYKAEKTKQFAWDVCGNVILDNLLKNNNHKIYYPQKTDKNEPNSFEYCGEYFTMCEKEIGGDANV